MLTVQYYRGPVDSVRPLLTRTDIHSITHHGAGLVLHASSTKEIPSERTYLVDPADIVLITATPPSPPPPRRRRSHK